MTREEVVAILTEYRKKLINSVSNQLDKDIEAFDMAIKALEQEPCEDAISRTDLIRKLQAWDAKANGIPNYAWGIIKELPSVTPKEKTGHWILGICDNCGYDWGKDAPIASVPNFCPNCGSRMIEPQEREE